jgi:hypothetical protein
MNSKQRRFHPRFVTDLSAAADYYDDISSMVGDRLRTEVQSKFELISENSDAFAKLYKDVRGLRLKSFPYVILYRSHTDHVEFVGLVHGSTKRDHWFDGIN